MTEANTDGAQRFTQALEAVPFRHLLTGMGQAIADSQFQLDWSSIRAAQAMSGQFVDEQGETHSLTIELADGTEGEDEEVQAYSLLELGFTPTFYQFTDTEIEIKVSFEISQEVTEKSSSFAFIGGGGLIPGGGVIVGAASTSASYSAKYNFKGDSTSAVKTRLVPLPAPAGLQERLQAMANRRRLRQQPSDPTAAAG